MKFTKFAAAPLLGIAMTLAACSGGADTEAEGDEAASTEEAAEPITYATDETGRFENEVGEGGLAQLNDNLAAVHSNSGHDIRVLIVASGNGDTAGAAQSALGESGGDAIIYVAARDQDIAVVGENIDDTESSSISQAMIEAFNQEDFETGFSDGIAATDAAMGS